MVIILLQKIPKKLAQPNSQDALRQMTVMIEDKNIKFL